MNTTHCNPIASKRSRQHHEGNGQSRRDGADLLKFLFEATSDFILEHDRAGRIIQASPSLAMALGYEHAAFCKLTLAQIADDDYLGSIDRCFQGGNGTDLHKVEGTLRCRTGASAPFRGMARNIR